MSNFKLDKGQGPHAASAISDEDLEYLLRIISLELAVRTDGETYSEQFHQIADARGELEEMLSHLRKDRERMTFAAAIRADLEWLPLTTDQSNDEVHGPSL